MGLYFFLEYYIWATDFPFSGSKTNQR